MRHIHSSIVSRHLVTRGNTKILRTPQPHIISSEEIPPRLIRRTLAQLQTNKSPFLNAYIPKVDAKSYPSPLCPICDTHTHDIISSTAPTYAPHCHPWFCGWTQPLLFLIGNSLTSNYQILKNVGMALYNSIPHKMCEFYEHDILGKT